MKSVLRPGLPSFVYFMPEHFSWGAETKAFSRRTVQPIDQ